MKDYGPGYESRDLTVYYFERFGSKDGVEGRFVQVSGGDRRFVNGVGAGMVFSREAWDRMLAAARQFDNRG